MEAVYEPIALGYTCETKFQLSRNLYFRQFPNKTQASLQLAMMPPAKGRSLFPLRLFDCQGTSATAVCEYIERDFQGVFEREDLVGRSDGVFHRSLGANHLHEFERFTQDLSQISPEELDAAYAKARPQFDQMSRCFRQMMTLPGPYLYVHACELFPSDAEIRRLIRALASGSPDHHFHILLLGYEGEWLDSAPYEGMVTAFHRPYRGMKPRKWNWWDIDYDIWDEALAPFKLGSHEVERDPSEENAQSLASDEPPAVHLAAPARSRQGLLRRLFGQRD